MKPLPGTMLVIGESVFGLVITFSEVKGLIGRDAYRVSLLTPTGIVESTVHVENFQVTWRMV